jgi:hypothetical protein
MALSTGVESAVRRPSDKLPLVHMLCLAVPAGLEFFLEVGEPLASRTSPPRLDKAQKEGRIQKIRALAARYRTELLAP